MIHRVILGAPFGNYLKFPYTTPTLGTYTYQPRGGAWRRLWKVLSTVRYYPGIGAWRNRLGLPNPGLSALSRQNRNLGEYILSVAGFSDADWFMLSTTAGAMRPAALELNISCPNCPNEAQPDHAGIFAAVLKNFAQDWHPSIIVKLPPVGYVPVVRAALDAGVQSFHCCNTIPLPRGGLSGKPLRPLAMQCLGDVRNIAHARGHRLSHLIGGGGNTSLDDCRAFLMLGATSVSVASDLFLPWRWRWVKRAARTLYDEDTDPKFDFSTLPVYPTPERVEEENSS